MSRYTLLILLLFICVNGNFAQELRNRDWATTPEAQQVLQSDVQQRQVVIYRIHGIVEKTLALQDVRFKTIGVARLADLLWKYDEPYARQLFERALSLTDTKGEIKESELLFDLRRNLIIMIAKRDSSWAKHLVEVAASDESLNLSLEGQAELNIEIASGLLEDNPRTAAEFAARGLQRSVTPSFIWFLKKLRQRNEAAANQLFLQALTRFTLQPVADANEFALLGTYLFTSPRISDGDSTSMMITRVGDVGIVDITADQPGVSPNLVHAYLETAVQILSRPITDPRQQQVGYVLGKLLLPKAAKYAPDLISLIGTAMSALASNVPQNLTQESAYLNINRVTLDSPEEKMSKAEKIPGAESRDMAYLDTAYNSWLKHDFKTARVAADKITDRDASSKLAAVINFGEGAQLLKDGLRGIAGVERLADELPQGIERALLYLGIAQSAAKAGDVHRAREAVRLAIKAAQSVTDARRPFLILAAAGQSADFDSARSLLADAVNEFNSQEGAEWSKVDWRQRIEIGPLVENFPLEVKDVEVRFGQAYRHAIANNLDAATSVSENFKNEQLRARAFVELAAAYLETLPKTTQAEETVVRVGEDGMRRSASKTIMPDYPEEDIRKHQQGVAVVEAQYNGKGNVTDTIIVEAPTSSIGQAVITAIKQWKFIPSTLKGEPISVRGKLTFYFVLEANQKGHVENPKRFQ